MTIANLWGTLLLVAAAATTGEFVCWGKEADGNEAERDMTTRLWTSNIPIAQLVSKISARPAADASAGKPPRAQTALLFEQCLAEVKRPSKEFEHDKELLEKAASAGTTKTPVSSRDTDSDAPKETKSPAASPGSPASFGPVIERTLGQLELLDLDTGRKAGPIAQGEPKQQPHLDLYLDFGADAQNRSFPMLMSQFLYTVRATNWDASADELEAVLRTNATPPRVRVLAKPQDSLPVTYWFRTRAGNLGTLQVLGFGTNPPEEVRIRYRSIKKKQ